jgi:hypothetical protein
MKKTFEKIIEDLHYQVPFKQVTDVGDTLLMLREIEKEEFQAVFTRVLRISPEIIHHREWWHVEVMFLMVPVTYATYIVTAQQLIGQHIFVSKGLRIFMKALDSSPLPVNGVSPPEEEEESAQPPPQTPRPPGQSAPRTAPRLTLVKLEAAEE